MGVKRRVITAAPIRIRERGQCSENELEQRDHDNQADQENDADGTAEKFQHGDSPSWNTKVCTGRYGVVLGIEPASGHFVPFFWRANSCDHSDAQRASALPRP